MVATKLLVKPPASAGTRTGIFLKTSCEWALRASAAIGPPSWKAMAMQPLMMPPSMAIARPLPSAKILDRFLLLALREQPLLEHARISAQGNAGQADEEPQQDDVAGGRGDEQADLVVDGGGDQRAHDGANAQRDGLSRAERPK